MYWYASRHLLIDELSQHQSEIFISSYDLIDLGLNMCEVHIQDLGKVNHIDTTCKGKLRLCNLNIEIPNTRLALDILKMESWMHMGCTANIIIKDIINIFVSISKQMRILLMGRCYHDHCNTSHIAKTLGLVSIRHWSDKRVFAIWDMYWYSMKKQCIWSFNVIIGIPYEVQIIIQIITSFSYLNKLY